ncbi:transglutaminase-like domain-containing protein [Brevibacillus ruminantium]|uniref:Transglutaminase-like domain-containing protein n=1 Tax=Brevibacillus ruminantium TaxID=2950604 RepID=A0ABY4WPN9_9BACL|nr:transglutaminase-like domain-containing protein [Brevibacillus ruminantium]USG66611.1 transglutaminase-like domain-containing protein [Brevibacillus ruminantium]
MFKKRLVMMMSAVCLLTAPMTALAGPSTSRIDASEASKGIVKIEKDPQKQTIEKIMISKGNQHFYYSVTDNNRFPLQLGDGKYTVTLLENVAGSNKYRMVENKEVIRNATDEQTVFLQPIQMIYWNDQMKAITKARELTQGLQSDKDKIAAVYNFMIHNISYDFEKAQQVTNDYLPSIEATMNESKGICYDYSALFAAMLRSQGIPTKLIMGRKHDINQYHAWNEVYLKDTNEWVFIDTTYDAAMVKGDTKPLMIKNRQDYVTEKQF